MKRKWIVSLGLIGIAVAVVIRNPKMEEKDNQDKKYITIKN